MTILYYLMGLIAQINQRLSRIHVNFIPMNWALMAGAGFLTLLGLAETRDAVVNGEKPRAVSVAEVLNHHDMARNFVTVHGLLFPVAVFEEVGRSGSSAETVKRSWLPMLDQKDQRALLVQIHGSPGEGGLKEGKETDVTGMLVSMDSELRRKLMDQGGKIEDVPIDTEYVLEQDRQPGNAVVWSVTTVGAGLVFVLLLITFANKYVVFQPRPRAANTMPVATVPNQGIDLRATGRFVLDTNQAQRFLNVPSSLATLETGELALLSNIDASSRFMGITTAKRAGMWAMVLQPSSLQKTEMGLLYLGLAARPALRLQYRDGIGGRPETVILSCANASEREALLQELSKHAGYSLA